MPSKEYNNFYKLLIEICKNIFLNFINKSKYLNQNLVVNNDIY